MALRLLHTADWQIGKIHSQFESDDASALFEARFKVVERLAELAAEHAVAAVLVAGDVFDAQTVSDKTVRRLFNAMQGFHGPWVLLPGNHDAALAESIWARIARLKLMPDNVIPCLTPEVRVIADRFALLPAPLVQRHTQTDVTEWFDSVATPDGLPRIGLAHGSVQGVLAETMDSDNPIAADRTAKAQLDYLALGDWHGSKRIDERTWYSGTPETDRFKDNESGHTLLVSIEAAGAVPDVEVVRTGRYRWQMQETSLTVASDVDRLLEQLATYESDDVLQLHLSGYCDLAGQQRIQHGIESARARLRALVLSVDKLAIEPTQDDIDALQADGYVGEVVQQLRDEQASPDNQRARDALVILAQLLGQQRVHSERPT